MGFSSSVSSVSTSYASGLKIDPQFGHILSCNFFPLFMIQEEQSVSNWHKNGHLMVNFFRKACPGTVVK